MVQGQVTRHTLATCLPEAPSKRVRCLQPASAQGTMGVQRTLYSC